MLPFALDSACRFGAGCMLEVHPVMGAAISRPDFRSPRFRGSVQALPRSRPDGAVGQVLRACRILSFLFALESSGSLSSLGAFKRLRALQRGGIRWLGSSRLSPRGGA